MTDMLVAPDSEVFPSRKRWAREECYRLMEEGILTGRWELVDGAVLSKSGQTPLVSVAVNTVFRRLTDAYGLAFVGIHTPITIPGSLGETNEPEPDVAVTLEPATAYADRHPGPEDVALIVEVSDTTLRFDLTTKALLYARAGVQTYWVADVLNRRLHCCSAPASSGYADTVVYGENEQLALPARPEAAILCGDLFPPQTTAETD